MEKRDYIWVAIRIFGIYLLVQAIFALLAGAGALLQACNYINEPADSPWRGQMYALAMTTLWHSVLAVLVYGALGVYLAFGGKLFFRWICPPDEPKANTTPEPPTPDGPQGPPSADQPGG
ncbi:MAG: hypothetical protein ABR915_21010 [Thermoguttaceae bacterium]|jgi:hypothetical protein